MIDKIHRFQGYSSLRFVYQKGDIVRGPLCALKYIENRRRTTYRAAIVVSRKVNKSAVVRNRIRRRIYEIIRHEEQRITKPFDLVIITYSDQLAELPQTELQQIIIAQLQKAGVFKTGAEATAPGRGIV